MHREGLKGLVITTVWVTVSGRRGGGYYDYDIHDYLLKAISIWPVYFIDNLECIDVRSKVNDRKCGINGLYSPPNVSAINMKYVFTEKAYEIL